MASLGSRQKGPHLSSNGLPKFCMFAGFKVDPVQGAGNDHGAGIEDSAAKFSGNSLVLRCKFE